MMNNEKEKQNLEVVENQEILEDTTISLAEQTKVAEIEEKEAAELDFMRTKLGFKRVIQRLRDEEGFEVDELAEQKRIEQALALENETVKEDLQRRFREYKESWTDSTKRKVKAKNAISIFAAFFRTFILVGLCFVILMPIIEKVSFALRAPQDIANKQVVWIPETWSFMNIRVAFSYLTLMKDNTYANVAFIYNISTYFNSLWLSLVTTVIQVISTAIAGYAFARLKFKGSGIIFLLAVLTLIVPSESLATARKLVFFNVPFFAANLMKNSFAIYYMSAFGMGLRSGIFIYIFRQFFRGIPIELEESSQIDGAGVFRTFWSVMLPNARGAIITVALFSFVWQWNDSYYIQVYQLNSEDFPIMTFRLLNVAEWIGNLLKDPQFKDYINGLVTSEDIKANGNFAAVIANTSALIMMTPLLIAYLFVQKQFVEGVERSGIVG